MQILKTLVASILLFGCQAAWTYPIYYEVEHVDGDVWQYSYTVGNQTAGLIDWFTVFFEYGLYGFDLVSGPFGDEVDPAVYGGPAGWDILVAAPDPLFPGPSDDQPGFFDAFALGAPIEPGTALSGFEILFTWQGSGTPGAQPFTLGGDLLPDFGANLFTEPRAVQVPEPGSLLLLGTALLAITTRRKWMRE